MLLKSLQIFVGWCSPSQFAQSVQYTIVRANRVGWCVTVTMSEFNTIILQTSRNTVTGPPVPIWWQQQHSLDCKSRLITLEWSLKNLDSCQTISVWQWSQQGCRIINVVVGANPNPTTQVLHRSIRECSLFFFDGLRIVAKIRLLVYVVEPTVNGEALCSLRCLTAIRVQDYKRVSGCICQILQHNATFVWLVK